MQEMLKECLDAVKKRDNLELTEKQEQSIMDAMFYYGENIRYEHDKAMGRP